MARRELTSIIGVPGEGVTLRQAQAHLRERGLELRADTISHIRNGDESGERIIGRLTAAEMLASDSSVNKVRFFTDICAVGVDLRDHQVGYGSNGHRFRSDGFTREVAEEIGLRDQSLRLAMRALRVDMVTSSVDDPDSKFTQGFFSAANSFFRDYVELGTRNNSKAIRVYEEWDGRIAGFYASLYSHLGPRSFGTWVPYEMDAIRAYIDHVVDTGMHLSTFDRRILSWSIQGKPIKENLGAGIREETGIKLDPTALRIHENILLSGDVLPR